MLPLLVQAHSAESPYLFSTTPRTLAWLHFPIPNHAIPQIRVLVWLGVRTCRSKSQNWLSLSLQTISLFPLALVGRGGGLEADYKHSRGGKWLGGPWHTCSWHGSLSAPASWQLCVWPACKALQTRIQRAFLQGHSCCSETHCHPLSLKSSQGHFQRPRKKGVLESSRFATLEKSQKWRQQPANHAIPVCAGRGAQSFTAPCDFSDNCLMPGLLPISDADAVFVLWRNRIYGNSHHWYLRGECFLLSLVKCTGV